MKQNVLLSAIISGVLCFVIGFDHFGENTKKRIIRELSASDKRAKALMGN